MLASLLVCPDLLAQKKNDDGALKRGFDNMVARYNIYFNAQLMLDDAVADLYEGHKDNFEEILPVFPWGDENAARNMRAPMDLTMKKASKVINKKPHSKWVDDAWLIIGQTYFYIDDEYAAVEAFQFLYSKFTDPEIRMHAQLWVMKCYLKQEKYNDAEAILSLIREKPPVTSELEGDIHITAGDLFVKQEKYQLAIQELTAGLPLTKNRILRYRINFILGQLYMLSENYEQARQHFEKVVRLNAPYVYAFQANLGMAKATSVSGGKGIKSTKKYLKRMLDDDKNIEYYDQIYYQLALLEFSEGNEKLGLEYMHRSSSNARANPAQQTKTYLFLADYYFNNREYELSQSYYDSAVTVLPKDYPDYDKITAKHAVLSKLIEHIETVEVQDSLLKLSAMPREELDQLIEKKIAEQQRQKKLAEEEAEMKRQRDKMNGPTGGGNPGGNVASDGSWYFYNQATVARGANDFTRIWGQRSYGDWWRYVNKVVAKDAAPKAGDDGPDDDPLTYNSDDDPDQKAALQDIAEDKLKYYQNIPFSTTAKLVANKKIQTALLEMGKIYYSDLKEYDKSIASLESFLKRYPQSLSRPEGIFYLAKAYLAKGDTANYDRYALLIAQEYPNSTYNQVLNSKEVLESGEDKEVLVLYERMYNFYQAEQYDSVRSIRNQVSNKYPGNSIQAKFDYLYALMIGKTEGKEAYIAELEAIAENYPGTDIANIAAYTITYLTTDRPAQGLDMSMFSDDLEGTHYYAITAKTEDSKQVEQQLLEYNERFFPGQSFQIKSYVFGDKTMFIIKSFPDKASAEAYHREMKANYTFLTTMGLEDINLYAITEENFRTLIKNEEESLYLYFFNKHYPFEL